MIGLHVLGIFLDTETNGLNPFKHKVVEIAFQIRDLETGHLVDSYQAIVWQSYDEWQNSDLASLQINGFNWEDVSLGIPLQTVSMQIQECFDRHKIKRGRAVFICQNPSFDRAFFAQIVDPDLQERLLWPYHWLDLASMHWSLALWKRKTSKEPYPWDSGVSKDRIAKVYNIPPEEKPHRAMNGVDHLRLCYQSVVGFPKQ
jgi:DNA polymerase-3 subunit epsilon/oligoribonuclease